MWMGKKPDGYWDGSAYRLTGEVEKRYGATWHKAQLLEGHRKGEKVFLLDEADQAAQIAKERADYKEQQAGFARLHKSTNQREI